MADPQDNDVEHTHTTHVHESQATDTDNAQTHVRRSGSNNGARVQQPFKSHAPRMRQASAPQVQRNTSYNDMRFEGQYRRNSDGYLPQGYNYQHPGPPLYGYMGPSDSSQDYRHMQQRERMPMPPAFKGGSEQMAHTEAVPSHGRPLAPAPRSTGLDANGANIHVAYDTYTGQPVFFNHSRFPNYPGGYAHPRTSSPTYAAHHVRYASPIHPPHDSTADPAYAHAARNTSLHNGEGSPYMSNGIPDVRNGSPPVVNSQDRRMHTQQTPLSHPISHHRPILPYAPSTQHNRMYAHPQDSRIFTNTQGQRMHVQHPGQPRATGTTTQPGTTAAVGPEAEKTSASGAYQVGVTGTNTNGTYEWATTYREAVLTSDDSSDDDDEQSESVPEIRPPAVQPQPQPQPRAPTIPTNSTIHSANAHNNTKNTESSADAQKVTENAMIRANAHAKTESSASNIASRATAPKVERPTPVQSNITMPPTAPPVVDLAAAEEEAEVAETEVFSSYKCLSIKFGKTHPGNIVEGASLASAHLPQPTYPLEESMPDDIITNGKLSNLQLEAILFASQRHQKLFNYRLTLEGEPMHAPRLGSGLSDINHCTRAGFFIGDQTGVGKGRQSAGIILANVARGRSKHVWFSTSGDLREDAERDMRDLGSYINIIDGCKELEKQTSALGINPAYKKGVLFCTYSTLARPARLEEIIKWCGGESFDGCLIFDESHKAKNLKMEGSKSSGSMTAAAALKIQRRMPLARVTYLSATGVTEPAHLGFMERLGLWGPHTSFPNFKAFHTEISKHGIAVLELIAMEMKMNGTYVSRGLSYADCEFEIVETDASKAHGALYDQCCTLWATLRQQMKIACEMTNMPLKTMRSYWSCHQRFFLQLCVSLKVGRIVELAKAALAQGDCVVIGLQKTGESSSDAVLDLSQPDKLYASPIAVEKEILMRFIAENFPTKMAPKDVPGDPDDPYVIERKRIEKQRANVTIPELLQTQQILIRSASALPLPGNPLDLLIDELGGPSKVAEMTGRKGRMVRSGNKGFVYEKRAETEDDTTHICNNEKVRFMNGDKLVAIISEAASTGISLHSSLHVPNQRRRHHFTIELPWSADRAIQQLGRTHRSHQKTGPIYKLVVCSLAGELRCVMAVCSRLQSLGALTRGDRRASVGFNFDDYDIDNKYGRKALKDMAVSIRQRSLYPGVSSEKMGALEQQAQLIAQGSAEQALGKLMLFPVLAACIELMAFEDGDEGKVENIRSFWNRLLGLKVAQQGILFGYLSAVLEAVVNEAKREGTYLDNVVDLKGENIEIQSKEALSKDPSTDVPTIHYEVLVNRGVSFPVAFNRLEQAQAAFSHRASQPDGDDDHAADKADTKEGDAADGANKDKKGAEDKGVDDDRGAEKNTDADNPANTETSQAPNGSTQETSEARPSMAAAGEAEKMTESSSSAEHTANSEVEPVAVSSDTTSGTSKTVADGVEPPVPSADKSKSRKRKRRRAKRARDDSESSDQGSGPGSENSDAASGAGSDSDSEGEDDETHVDYSGFYVSKVPHFGRYMLLLATGKANNPYYVNAYRPNTGKGVDLEVDSLLKRYKLVKPKDMEQQWTDFYDATKDYCTHKRPCRCSTGKRTLIHHIINGNIVQQWSTIQGITLRNRSTQAPGRNNMQIVRLETSGGERLVGISLSEQCIYELSVHLQEKEHVLATTHSRANMTIEPVGALKAKQLQRAMTKPRDITTYFGAATATSKQEPKVEDAPDSGAQVVQKTGPQKRMADSVDSKMPAKMKPIVTTKKRKVKKPTANASLVSIFNKQRSKKLGISNSTNVQTAPQARPTKPKPPVTGPKEEPEFIMLD